jgi:hypothetical protein
MDGRTLVSFLDLILRQILTPACSLYLMVGSRIVFRGMIPWTTCAAPTRAKKSAFKYTKKESSSIRGGPQGFSEIGRKVHK